MQIITHPGPAHRDDFLSCCFLLGYHQLHIVDEGISDIVRRDPYEAELDDPNTFVVDIGQRHEPSRRNFDHHQFNPDDEPCQCAFSLVLKEFGYYEKAKRAMPTLRFTEVLDMRGPYKLAAELGIAPKQLMGSLSPVEAAVLKIFAEYCLIEGDQPIYQIMTDIGVNMVAYLDRFEDRFNYLVHEAKVEQLTQYQALFVMDASLDQPALAMDKFRESLEPHDIAASVTPDTRGPGWALYRYEDDPRIDFRRVSGDPRIDFIHTGGHLATTKEPLERAEVIGLLEKATCAS